MNKVRSISIGGVLRKYLKQLEEEPEDLIGSDEENAEAVSEALLYFGWKQDVKEYKLED
jgi:hypothetical protein